MISYLIVICYISVIVGEFRTFCDALRIVYHCTNNTPCFTQVVVIVIYRILMIIPVLTS